jgi:hypothetical protein
MPVSFMVVGFIVGFVFASYFVFPPGVLDIELAHLTMANLLRIVIGVITFFVGGGLGLYIGIELQKKKSQ